MAASVKEKNMPNMPSNLYGGLQRWVNRASVSLRERKKSRRNSDTSHTLYHQNRRLTTRESDMPAKLVPLHARSSSSPVVMPDSYLVVTSHRKIPEVPKTHPQEVLLQWNKRDPKYSYNNNDSDENLSKTCSKSESNLITACNYSDDLPTKSNNSPSTKSWRLRRTSSQDTINSVESCTSDLDIERGNKKSRSPQALNKTNKRKKRPNLDSVGVTRCSEKMSSSPDYEKVSRNVNSRLDRWIRDSRQSSFESTSSSDDAFISENRRVRPMGTREMRALQTALNELVSGCSQRSRRDSIGLLEESIEATNTTLSERLSLSNTDSMLDKPDEVETCSLQRVRQSNYQLKKCGSSSESYFSVGSDEKHGERHSSSSNNELEGSYDSLDGRVITEENVMMESAAENMECEAIDGNAQSSVSCDDGRVLTYPTHDRGLADSTMLASQNLERNVEDCKEEAGMGEECQHLDDGNCKQRCPLSRESKQTEDTMLYSKQSSKLVSIELEKPISLPAKSPKNYPAPSPPVAAEIPTREKEKAQENGRHTFFNHDADLAAFAAECLKQADKLELKTRSKESKSDSEEEKKGIDFVYIPRNNETVLKDSVETEKQIPNKSKSATHPKTRKLNQTPSYLCLSDDNLQIRKPNDEFHQKRNSDESLDGIALFDKDTEEVDFENLKPGVSNEMEDIQKDTVSDDGPSNLRKFPSMPLFYVPKEFEGDEIKNRKSLRKTIWNRIKSLPRPADNSRAANQNVKTKQESLPARLDPFYHAPEKDDQDLDPLPAFRSKAWTLNNPTSRSSQTQARLRRPSLETRRSEPALKVTKQVDEQVVVVPEKIDESQC